MHIVVHLIVFAAAGAAFFLLTRPAELSGDRRWKTHLSHVLLICAMLGLGAHSVDATGVETVAVIGAFASLLCLGFLWVPNFAFLAGRGAVNLLYGDGRGGAESGADFREGRACIKDREWAEAIQVLEPELAKQPNDFEGRTLLAEACVQLKFFDKALAQMEVILKNPAATSDQQAWAKSQSARYRQLQKHRNVGHRAA